MPKSEYHNTSKSRLKASMTDAIGIGVRDKITLVLKMEINCIYAEARRMMYNYLDIYKRSMIYTDDNSNPLYVDTALSLVEN